MAIEIASFPKNRFFVDLSSSLSVNVEGFRHCHLPWPSLILCGELPDDPDARPAGRPSARAATLVLAREHLPLRRAQRRPAVGKKNCS